MAVLTQKPNHLRKRLLQCGFEGMRWVQDKYARSRQSGALMAVDLWRT